jgi:hypothetical protein
MKKMFLLFLFISILSCEKEQSLQRYFVLKTESNDFISVDVSPSILNSKPELLSAEEQKALESFKKMNILAFKVTEQNQVQFDAERDALNEILKDEKYQQLIKFSSGKEGAAVYFVGTEEAIEEFVLYGNKKEDGFAVVRILGENMNPEDFMVLLKAIQKSDIDMEQFKPLQEILK